MRTIRLATSDQERFANFCAVNNRQVQEAIGYLSTWNMSGFSEVNIFWSYQHEEFTANYSAVNHARTYTIGAIWDAERCIFTFHS